MNTDRAGRRAPRRASGRLRKTAAGQRRAALTLGGTRTLVAVGSALTLALAGVVPAQAAPRVTTLDISAPRPWWQGMVPWDDTPTVPLTPFDPAPPAAAIVVAQAPAPVLQPEVVGAPTKLPAARPASGVDCRVVRCVALTFDDGPSDQTTPRLLDILAREGVRATFYVVGHRVNANPEVLARAAAEGHEIGNHTYGHEDLTKLADNGADEIGRDQTAVNGVLGVTPQTMRPPYGAHDAGTDAVAARAGLPVIMWDVDTLDWKTRNADRTVAAVASQTRPGSIILIHDIHEPSVDAVPRVIAELKSRGYTFVTVTDLLDEMDLRPGQVYTHGPR